MPLLSRDQILNAEDMSYEDVECPEWGGTVRVRAMSGAERDQFEASYIGAGQGKKNQRNWKNIRARMAALVIIDDKGKRLFSQADIEALGRKSAAALDRVFDKAMRLSGMRDEDIDDLTENFTEDPNDDSTSD